MKNKIHILSTASLNETLLNKLAKNNIDTEVYPFIRTTTSITNESRQRISEMEQHSQVVIFTSANAVNAVGEILKGKPNWKIYCIQGVTQEAVLKYFGDSIHITTAANAENLATKIIAANEASLVFFCGNRRLDILPRQLENNQIALEEIVVYNTDLTPIKASMAVDGILFFSSSAVKSFLSMNQPATSTVCFAIGETTAGTLKEQLTNRIILSKEPNKNSIVEEVIAYYNEHI